MRHSLVEHDCLWLDSCPAAACRISLRVEGRIKSISAISVLAINLDMNYDAILVVSFGGPESKEDVIPFLENVLRGRNVPRERMLAVAEHYYHFEGKSPINQQARALMAALEAELQQNGPKLPIYWGNRNWHPLLTETLRRMKQDGVRQALAFVTSAYSSYSGCRQYREDIAHAQNEVGSGAPEVDKLRAFFNHPAFIEATVERVRDALQDIPENARGNVQIVYTAHSIPVSMANSCDYVKQVEEVRRLVSAALGHKNDALVYQSRSGAPGQPWLEPDILDYLRRVKAANLATAVVLAPIGFISDHMEVLYDLDVEARQLCDSLGLPMARAKTVGVHPKFVGMIRELIVERMNPGSERRALGSLGPRADVCSEECCPAPGRPGNSGQ
jgi:ferrochelatase